MGMVSRIAFESIDTEKYLASYPSLPLRVRLADKFVNYFPRRFFKRLSPQMQDKIVSHALLFRNQLEPLPQCTIDNGVEMGLADEKTVRKMATHKEAFPVDVYLKRLHDGDCCYYLTKDGEIACYQWVSFKTCGIYCGFESEFSFLRLKDREAYIYDLYTYENSRGHGYANVLKRYILSDLYNKKIQTIFGAIHHDNFVSLKMHIEAGFELIGLVYMYRLMSMTKTIWGTGSEIARVQNWLEKISFIKRDS